MKLKSNHEIVQELKGLYPMMFVGKQKWYTIEELITLVHAARAILSEGADHVRIDVLNRIHGKPLQAVMTMDHTTPIEEGMTTDQTREALERVRATMGQFERSQAYQGKGTDDDGQDSDQG